ncbi:hypothetical protein LNP05_16130 [Klebsiella pneumoniae subsp. pneumoniae]|nr:hypothetical protein [Klebsiella pneumoniae subsp. pneumoniae]
MEDFAFSLHDLSAEASDVGPGKRGDRVLRRRRSRTAQRRPEPDPQAGRESAFVAASESPVQVSRPRPRGARFQ